MKYKILVLIIFFTFTNYLFAEQEPAKPEVAEQKAAKPEENKDTNSMVYSVLFFRPDCPHCHKVVKELLEPISNQYRGRALIITVNISTENGKILFDETIKQYNVPAPRQGVPMLVVGDITFVGEQEIMSVFPSVLAIFMNMGGIRFPYIPGLQEAIDLRNTKQTNTTSSDIVSVTEQTMFELVKSRILKNPLGNSIAMIIFFGMIFVLIKSLIAIRYVSFDKNYRWKFWVIPLLALIGMCVSGYLSWFKSYETDVICKIVGDCGLVQNSKYAKIFGIHVGIIGFAGYIAVIFVWLLMFLRSFELLGSLILFGMVFIGTVFSAYLTFIEPFVLGTVCFWCLISASMITIILWLTPYLFKSISFKVFFVDLIEGNFLASPLC
ncbi:MAG: hypothetical protein HQK76_09945 [Desulfobacterales bacterium]|nr:hypothetical protein [Desulfobacterales bacterium]